MNIYTSYWAQVRNFPKNLVGLNTTIWPPKWHPMGKDKNGVICVDCPPLKPGKACEGLCNGKCNPKHPTDCAFLKTYKKQLDEIYPIEFFQSLNNLAEKIKENEGLDDIDFALLFYEKYDNPCSERWPVQQWFKEHGILVKEWNLNT